MRLGTLCPAHALSQSSALLALGFEFIEIQAPSNLANLALPPADDLPSVPLIWQCPPDLPMEHSAPHIREAVLTAWRAQLQMAGEIGAKLIILQFRRPVELGNKASMYAFVEQCQALLEPITEEARALNVQPVLRMSADNREQLTLLREIMRGVAGLGLGLDIAYAGQRVVKNLLQEYLWDSDLSPRIAHVYAAESDGLNPDLRLPLACLKKGGLDWPRLVSLLRERYNASVTLDIGSLDADYLALSRAKWLAWWTA